MNGQLIRTQVDFEQDDGTHIRNIVSSGSSGDPLDLFMTFMFEFRLPHVQPGTPEEEKEHAKLKAVSCSYPEYTSVCGAGA